MICCSKIIIGSNLGSQNLWVQTKFDSSENKWPKLFFGPKDVFDPKELFDQKKNFGKKIVSKIKILNPKNDFGPNYFWLKNAL